ncbi:MAG: ATP-binding protein [Gammaproteobacteria bacterium]|nr:ATP-binding protein [Gammaproteobacteria bacterium]MCZ6879846.1 ATP-binding protein [Gammaproteobacteria bacterium]
MEKKFKRSLEEIRNIVSMTTDFFAQESLDNALRNTVDLATEELFVNMVTYNTETEADILIEMQRANGGIEVSLTDYGVDRFDPTKVTTLDTEVPLNERNPGGLGLYLVLKMVDSIHYEYHDRTSKITFRQGVA